MKGWIAVSKREPNVPNPVCYFPAGAFRKDSPATISTIEFPGFWRDRKGGFSFTYWRTVESLSPSAASHSDKEGK